MPIHEYECCGAVYESFKSNRCPVCGQPGKLLISAPSRIIVHSSESLPLGNKSRGRFIPPHNGMPGILVPSFGLLEKEEVDYLTEGMIEKHKNEVRVSETKTNLERLTKLARNTPRGKRAKIIKQAIGEGR
jgi:hypothetical protein